MIDETQIFTKGLTYKIDSYHLFIYIGSFNYEYGVYDGLS